jgi:hypothetical protein
VAYFMLLSRHSPGNAEENDGFLKMEAVCSSEKRCYPPASLNNPEDEHQHLHSCENLKSTPGNTSWNNTRHGTNDIGVMT